MNLTGERLIAAAQTTTWAALNDPAILKRCIPGCESIEQVGPDEFQVLMTARVGPISAKFKGKLTLADVIAPTSYTIVFDGQGGAAGFGKGTAKVHLSPEGEATKLRYEANASVGGKIAQVGSRLVDSAARKIAEDFFDAFNAAVGVATASEQVDTTGLDTGGPHGVPPVATATAGLEHPAHPVASQPWPRALILLAVAGAILLTIWFVVSGTRP